MNKVMKEVQEVLNTLVADGLVIYRKREDGEYVYKLRDCATQQEIREWEELAGLARPN